MRKEDKKDPELKMMDDCINTAIDDVHGEFVSSDIYDACRNADTGMTPEMAFEYLFYSRIDRVCKSRHREKPIVNGDFFAETYQDRLMIDGDKSVKVRDCTWRWHKKQRSDQLAAIDKSQAKFEIDEIRRDQLGVVMATDESITTGEAIAELGLNSEEDAA